MYNSKTYSLNDPHHIMEIQVQLRGLMEVRNDAHDFYERIRAVLPENAVDIVIDRLTRNTTLDLGITSDEWNHVIDNPQVKHVLDELGVDNELRPDIFSCVDSDGTGVVTTSQLVEGLLLCRDPPRSHDLLEVRLKVRDMQQWLRSELKHEVGSIRRTILSEAKGHKQYFTNGSKPFRSHQPIPL